MLDDWGTYVDVYDRVLTRTASYRGMLTDLLGRTGPLPPLRDGRVVVDLGSGTGNLIESVMEECPGTIGVAVDRDRAMLEVLRHKLADRLSPDPQPGRVCVLEADVMDAFPWLASHGLRPDCVFLVNVLFLVHDPPAAVRAIAGSLAPTGELRLSNPDEHTDLEALLGRLQQDLADAGVLGKLRDEFATVQRFNRRRLSSRLHRLTSADIIQLVRDAGFSRIPHVTHDHYAGQSLLLSATR